MVRGHTVPALFSDVTPKNSSAGGLKFLNFFHKHNQQSSSYVQKKSESFSNLFTQNKYLLSFVGTSFLIHSTALKNKLNMWYRKQAMQIQTKHQMNWFGKL